MLPSLRLKSPLISPAQDPSSWALQMEVLKVLLQLVSYFSRFLSRFLPGLMASCWKMLTSGLEAYQLGLVDGKAEEVGGVRQSYIVC